MYFYRVYYNKVRKYKKQKGHAKKRGISWQLNYTTWWKIWCKSGKWEKRGTKRGQYVMARFGDKGPYAPWNVRICTVSENHREKKLSPEAWKRISISMIGNKRGLGNKNRLGKKFSQESLLLISKASKEHASKRKRNANGQFV